MKKIEILRIESLSRAPLVIEGYLFEGSDPKAPSVAMDIKKFSSKTSPLRMFLNADKRTSFPIMI